MNDDAGDVLSGPIARPSRAALYLAVSSPPRLAVVTTHPVQYSAPLFRRLTERGEVEPHVFYSWQGAADEAALDRGFGTSFAWDIPLLDGYAHSFLDNVADEPGTHHFRGIDAPSLVPTIEAWGPDAVLVIGWNHRAHLQALRTFHGRRPVLFRGDSTLIDERRDLAGHARALARRLALRWVYHHVDHALYVGTHNRAYFRAHGLGEAQLSWAPHAIDTERFAAPSGELEAEARAWRGSLGIADADRAAVFVGKLEPKKAPGVLLDAFLGGASGLDHLVFCGTGPLEDDLRAHARDRSDVHFLGFQNQTRMPLAYRLGDVVVLPSRGPGETWGLAVNEAMACRRPTVVTDRVGCAPDLVTAATGRVVPAGDAGALAAALAEIAAPGVAERLGAQAFEHIQAWTLDETARRIGEATVAVVREMGG